ITKAMTKLLKEHASDYRLETILTDQTDVPSINVDAGESWYPAKTPSEHGYSQDSRSESTYRNDSEFDPDNF
ncbi:hypothetical protein FRC12_006875, partial [Ceratobasidium sp. 428]